MPSFSRPWSAPTPIPMMLIPSPLSPEFRKKNVSKLVEKSAHKVHITQYTLHRQHSIFSKRHVQRHCGWLTISTFFQTRNNKKQKLFHTVAAAKAFMSLCPCSYVFIFSIMWLTITVNFWYYLSCYFSILSLLLHYSMLLFHIQMIDQYITYLSKIRVLTQQL